MSAASLARALVAAIAEDPDALAQLRELLRDDTGPPGAADRRAAFTVATLAAELDLSPKAIRAAIGRGASWQAVKRGGRWVIASGGRRCLGDPGSQRRRGADRRRAGCRAPAAAGTVAAISVHASLEASMSDRPTARIRVRRI